MKFVALVSGGKDSYYAIQQAIEVGHELVACLHMARPNRKTTTRTTTITSTTDKPAQQDNEEEEEEESYMYQSAASEVVRMQVEQCLQVPYYEYTRQGKSQQTSLIYQQQSQDQSQQQSQQEHDEVEDLYHALQWVLDSYSENTKTKNNIEAVCSGAILSTYQRVRIEYVVCHQLKLHSLAYLWRATSQDMLLHHMLQSGLDAILVRTAAPPGLLPHRHLNQRLSILAGQPQQRRGNGTNLHDRGDDDEYELSHDSSSSYFAQLYHRYQFHMCGEGGEYETLCIDSPLFHQRLIVDQVHVELDDTNDDTVGNLRILNCHVQDKSGTTTTTTTTTGASSSTPLPPARPPPFNTQTAAVVVVDPRPQQEQLPLRRPPPPPNVLFLPRIKRGRGGLWHVSEITSSSTHRDSDKVNDDDTEAELAVQEALEIFATLAQVLEQQGCTAQDVVMVHLYLSQMSHFVRINHHYQSFFGRFLPPSRSCIAMTSNTCSTSKFLEGGHRVMLDCLVQSNSGQAMRRMDQSGLSSTSRKEQEQPQQPPPQRRQVLHVQSRSFWAPVCVGPYSQANTLWKALHYLAGQIGLHPPTMTLVQDDKNDNAKANQQHWIRQLPQTWTNLAQVVDALDQGSLKDNLLSCLIYIPKKIWDGRHGHGEYDGEDHGEATVLSTLQESCRASLERNGGVIPGFVDKGKVVLAAKSNTLFGGYEDEETMREMQAQQQQRQEQQHNNKTMQQSTWTTAPPQDPQPMIPHILVVSIAELPVGADIEVEIVAATQTAAKCLHRTIHPATSMVCSTENLGTTTAAATIDGNKSVWRWDTGQDDHDDDDQGYTMPTTNTSSTPSTDDKVAWRFSSNLCTLGRGCAGYAIVNVSLPLSTPPCVIAANVDQVLDVMIQVLEQSLLNELSLEQVLHIRLYYLVGSSPDRLRSALTVALTRRSAQLPAVSLIPVFAMQLLAINNNGDNNNNNNMQPSNNGDERSAGYDGGDDREDDKKTTYRNNETDKTKTILAMQVTLVEPTNLETELWIRSDR